MSVKNIIAALEEFTEEVSSEIVNEQPTDGDFSEETAGVDFPQESSDIDSDLTAITEAAQGLEDIISLVEEAPGENCEPLQPFVEKAVNVALESNDMVAEAGNPVDPSKDKTKEAVLEKIKAFAKKVWEMLRNFGKKIAAWVREIWAKYTDRIVRNANRAQKILEEVKSLEVKGDAKITDKSLLAKIATPANVGIDDVLLAVAEHADYQGSRAVEELTKEARACVTAVASGGEVQSSVMDRFLAALAKAAGAHNATASDAQAQAIKAPEGTEVLLSAPFFGGYRAWVTVPKNATELSKWNHGLSKVDDVKAAESIDAPDAGEIKSIADFIIDLGKVVKVYQGNLKALDALNSELDKAAKQAGNAGIKSGEERKALQAMQAVIPRIIKGPQVAAYGYAASASTVALQLCESAIRAHRGETTVGEKVGAAAGKAGSAARGAAASAQAAASGAAGRVKGAFGKKAE